MLGRHWLWYFVILGLFQLSSSWHMEISTSHTSFGKRGRSTVLLWETEVKVLSLSTTWFSWSWVCLPCFEAVFRIIKSCCWIEEGVCVNSFSSPMQTVRRKRFPDILPLADRFRAAFREFVSWEEDAMKFSIYTGCSLKNYVWYFCSEKINQREH